MSSHNFFLPKISYILIYNYLLKLRILFSYLFITRHLFYDTISTTYTTDFYLQSDMLTNTNCKGEKNTETIVSPAKSKIFWHLMLALRKT